MSSVTDASPGSAFRWGPLWGARPEDWALSEERQIPTYEAALRHVGLEPGQHVLDMGCGVGAFLPLVADHGAVPYGIEASEALIELLGRSRALRPRGDEADRTTVPAATSAGRAARPGSLPAGRPEDARGRRRARSRAGVRHHVDARVSGRAAARPRLARVAGLAVLAGPEREGELREAIVDGLASYRSADGSYRLSNEHRFLIARA